MSEREPFSELSKESVAMIGYGFVETKISGGTKSTRNRQKECIIHHINKGVRDTQGGQVRKALGTCAEMGQRERRLSTCIENRND